MAVNGKLNMFNYSLNHLVSLLVVIAVNWRETKGFACLARERDGQISDCCFSGTPVGFCPQVQRRASSPHSGPLEWK